MKIPSSKPRQNVSTGVFEYSVPQSRMVIFNFAYLCSNLSSLRHCYFNQSFEGLVKIFHNS